MLTKQNYDNLKNGKVVKSEDFFSGDNSLMKQEDSETNVSDPSRNKPSYRNIIAIITQKTYKEVKVIQGL